MLLDQSLYPLYLKGKWVNCDQALTVINPATGQSIAEVGTVDRYQVWQAIDDARVALPAWQSKPALQRAELPML